MIIRNKKYLKNVDILHNLSKSMGAEPIFINQEVGYISGIVPIYFKNRHCSMKLSLGSLDGEDVVFLIKNSDNSVVDYVYYEWSKNKFSN